MLNSEFRTAQANPFTLRTLIKDVATLPTYISHTKFSFVCYSRTRQLLVARQEQSLLGRFVF